MDATRQGVTPVSNVHYSILRKVVCLFAYLGWRLRALSSQVQKYMLGGN